MSESNSDYTVTLEREKGDAFSRRVRQLAGEFGGIPNLARACDFSDSVVRKWIKGASEPSRLMLIKLGLCTGCSFEWLLLGVGSQYPDRAPDQVAEDGRDSGYYYVPFYNVEAAAGYGRLADNEAIKGHLAFKKSFINHDLGASARDLALITVTGDSMDPTLKSGDTIMINQGRPDAMPQDGLYVLHVDGSLLVKRLQALPGDRVLISSDNPSYKPFEVSRGDLSNDDAAHSIGIVGRVVWTGRRV